MSSENIALLAIPPVFSAVEQGESSIAYGELTKQINENSGLSLNPHGARLAASSPWGACPRGIRLL